MAEQGTQGREFFGNVSPNKQCPAQERLSLLGERYRQYLEVINRSVQTVRSYKWHLRKFFNYLAEIDITDVQEVTSKIVLDYQKHLFYSDNTKGRQDTIRTQNNHLKVVKDFFRFLYEEDYTAHNPAKEIAYAKEPQSLPKIILTKEEAKKIIRQPDINTILGYRDRAILELLYSTGIRRDELRNIQLEDVDYEAGFVRINKGKGNKDRVVPLGRIACKYLENYIKGVRVEFCKVKESKHLFLSKKSVRLGKNILGCLIERYTKQANLKKHVTCHTFRHTCATHMVRNRANLRHVQEMLGHKSLNTTQKYIQLTITDLKEAHRKYHPRERDKS